MKFKIEKTRAFWAYIVGGFLCMIVGGVLFPLWSKTNVFFKGWGFRSVSIMISGLLLAYILLYLVKRIKRYSNTPAQIVAVVELVLMAVIAVLCVVSDFVPNISLGGPCQIFAIALWVRGASGVYTGYYCDSEIVKEAEEEKKAEKEKKKGKNVKSSEEAKETKSKKKSEIDTEKEPRGRVDDFTVWRLTLAIALISLGTYLFLRPAFEKIHLQWVFSCAIIVTGFFFVVLGFALKPKRIKVEEKSKTEEGEGVDVKESAGEKITDAKESKDGLLEEGKVKVKLSGATAMTKTAAYDAIKDDDIKENNASKETALTVKSDEQ